MNEKERAERLAHDLDLRFQHRVAFTEQTAPEDRPLLELAEGLAEQAPFAATAAERSQLQQLFEQLHPTNRRLRMGKPLSRFLKPTFRAVLWAAILIGIFTVAIVLVFNLIGKPGVQVSAPAPTTPTPAPQPTAPSEPTATQAPKPVGLNLDQALALVQNPTWSTAFFEYQAAWRSPNGKEYSFYKQAWMDQEGHGRVLSSDQVEGTGPRSAEIKPSLLFISDGSSLQALHLPSGQEETGFKNSPWRVSPLENAGEGMAAFFSSLSGVDQAGDLALDPFEDEVAGRPALVIRGKDSAYWYDRGTGLLLRKERSGENTSQLTVTRVAYNTALPPELSPADAAKAAFIEIPLSSAPQAEAPAKAPFPIQTQTVNDVQIELREVASVGSSLRATLCYLPPSQAAWRLEGVELQARDPNQVLTFYPSSSATPAPGADGLACETFLAAHPGISPTGTWTITVRRLLVPRETSPDCALANQQLSMEFPGLTVTCETIGSGFGYSIDKVPDGMDPNEAPNIVNTYLSYDVRGGPWKFTFEAGKIIPRFAAGLPASPVVVPAACDPNLSRLEDGNRPMPLDYHARLRGTAGEGTAQSGDFTFQMALACDPNFTRLMTGGDYYSEINGLGFLWILTYQGQPTGGEVKHYSGIEPFVQLSGGTGSMEKNSRLSDYIGLHFPENVLPDFTRSDVRLRYVVKVKTPDGAIRGAALSFTLTRAPEGYRPMDVTVEPLSDAELRTAESDPNAPLPFPTVTPENYAGLARKFLQAGDLLKGIQYAEKAVQREPSNPGLHSLLGTLYYKTGDYQLAIHSLSLAVNGGTTINGVQVLGIPMDKTPETINLYSRYGLALAMDGQCDQALQVARKISETAPEDEAARYNVKMIQEGCRTNAAGVTPTGAVPIGTLELLNLLDRWAKPLVASPGWVYLRTRTLMPGGSGLYGGLTEYTSEDWFQIDAQAQVVSQIHIDKRLDGSVLQQTASQNGKSINFTFGSIDDFRPYPLDPAYAVKDTLKNGEKVKLSQVTIDGKPAILLALNGMFTRRDAVDAASGAWLYTETVKLQPGDDPFTGGSLDNRTTLETAERVAAPSAEAQNLLSKEPSGYTPPAPYGTPAPQGFDPSKSRLSYHSIQGDSFNMPSFWYGDISASDQDRSAEYLLGRVEFGSVPDGYCDRSADGAKLAFNYVKVDPNGSVISNSLRWFDLRSIKNIHQPAPEITNIGVLSWSPRLPKLAVFGCKADHKDCGLYLLDPAADQVRLIKAGVYANWQPIWNPAGTHVAFVDTLKEGYTLYVIDINTGQVTYQGKFNADAWQVPADSPTNAWGVTFPRGASGSRCFETK